MAVVLEKTESATGRVALVAAWSHQRRAHLVIETSLGALVDAPLLDPVAVVVVVELDVVEIVVDEMPDWASLEKAIRQLAANFSRVVVLAPSAAMGDAHRELRGTPATLQQWWFEGDVVRFGVEELL
jgi:hypothetical protein